MDIELNKKLQVLGTSAKYDVSCVSSGSSRTNEGKGLGNAIPSGICHSWTSDGRCVSLLKLLMTNHCIYDCAYCINRRSNDIQRSSFTEEELIRLTVNFYKRNYIEGLFLSSGIIRNPDYTMEKIYRVAKRLREEENFRGYIHLKAIPGAGRELIRKAALYADRMSVNLELPTEKSLTFLAPQKSREAIFSSFHYLDHTIKENREDKEHMKHTPVYIPAGQSTQIIVGATPEPDSQILRLSSSLYNKFSMKRVFYSAYDPVNRDNRLPDIATPPLVREHRLYQADWLMRFYRFKVEEILTGPDGNLDMDIDPKTAWALKNMDLFPLEINRADYDLLIRIPGIGIQSARKIIRARRSGALDFDDLKKIRVVLKRAKYFITCKGRYNEGMHINPGYIRNQFFIDERYTQPWLF